MHPIRTSVLALSITVLACLKLFGQTPEVPWADTMLAKRLIDESRQLNRAGDHHSALEKAREAYSIYTHWYGGQHPSTAKARMYVAREYRNLDQEQTALALFGQSLPIFETAADTFRMAICHLSIALCLRDLYRCTEAHQHLQTGIELLRPDSLQQATVIADLYVGVGSVFNTEKNYRAAIPVLENTKIVYARHQMPEATGMASYHLGGAWFGLHDYVRAKEQYLSALADMKNQLKPGHSYFNDLYVKIGLCCQKTGESELGLQHLLEAKTAYLAAGKENLNYIQFLKSLGEFYLGEAKYPEAIEQLEACLTAKEKLFGHQNFHLLGTLQALGDACLENRQLNRAENCYRRALQILADSNETGNYFQYRFYNKLAEIQFVQGDFAGCILRCDTAFAAAGFQPEFPENVLPRDYCRELCQLYARAQLAQFHLTTDTALLLRAELYFSIAANMLYREVEEITVKSSREIFYDRDHLLLEQWLDARMQRYAATQNADQAEAAFQIAARSKAFLLLEAMRQSGALHFAGVPDSILSAELSSRERIVAAEKELETQNQQSLLDSSTLWLNQVLVVWRNDYDVLLQRIETSYPEYFRLRKLRREITTSELRKKALAPDQALLMYSFTDSQLYAFVLNRDSFYAIPLPLQARLNADLESFKTALTAYHSAPDPADALYDRQLEICTALAQSLYRQLVLPLAHMLPERVILIPDGKLWYLPFEALLSAAPADAGNFRSYAFWGQEKALSYCLSPDFLLQNTGIATQKPTKTWLGLAPFSSAPHHGATAARTAQGVPLALLPYSGSEVRSIATLLHGDVWLDTAARPGRFQNEAPQYRILHLATHSRADDRLGDYAYLALSASGHPTPAKDMYQTRIAADMVVLSACEAGGGQLLRGEGIIGMVRAFTYAGAKSVVASLWLANDQSTANLMVDYYRNLRQGMPKDRALQVARVHLFQQFPAQAHPFYWAGFRVYGQLNPLF